MGHHLPWTGRLPRGAPQPSITWREYVTAFAAVIEVGDTTGAPGALAAAVPLGSRDRGQAAGRPVPAEPPRRRRRDAACHRRLGLAHLAAGRDPGAVWHLEIAYRLTRRDAWLAVGLAEALRIQHEGAVLRLVLVGLYARLGRSGRAASIARETQALL